MPERCQRLGRSREQVCGREFDTTGKRVGDGIFTPALDQRLTAFQANHRSARTGKRQREIARAAEQISDPLTRLRVEQAQRPAHQNTVDRVVDLGEIGWPEFEFEAEFRQQIR